MDRLDFSIKSTCSFQNFSLANFMWKTTSDTLLFTAEFIFMF